MRALLLRCARPRELSMMSFARAMRSARGICMEMIFRIYSSRSASLFEVRSICSSSGQSITSTRSTSVW